jgi:uncharacterized damage-inducible protein DinB
MEATTTPTRNRTIQGMINELTHEAAQTRKMLERVPFDKWDYKPHEKSMSLGSLTVHIAELPAWVSMTLNTDELDFAKWEYKPYQPKDKEDLLSFFDKNVEQAIATLEAEDGENMLQPWTMRRGETIFFTMPKIAVARSFAMNHLVHHRGQLSVYLRMNDVAIPGMYGPSADEKF